MKTKKLSLQQMGGRAVKKLYGREHYVMMGKKSALARRAAKLKTEQARLKKKIK